MFGGGKQKHKTSSQINEGMIWEKYENNQALWLLIDNKLC